VSQALPQRLGRFNGEAPALSGSNSISLHANGLAALARFCLALNPVSLPAPSVGRTARHRSLSPGGDRSIVPFAVPFSEKEVHRG
jgi:hypothetical protein